MPWILQLVPQGRLFSDGLSNGFAVEFRTERLTDTPSLSQVPPKEDQELEGCILPFVTVMILF